MSTRARWAKRRRRGSGTLSRMPEAILVNGAPVDAGDARRARPRLRACSAHGVYESIRTYGGVPFALERAPRAARRPAPPRSTSPARVDELRAEVRDAVARLGHGGETRIRIVLTAGGTRIVSADPLPDRSGDRASAASRPSACPGRGAPTARPPASRRPRRPPPASASPTPAPPGADDGPLADAGGQRLRGPGRQRVRGRSTACSSPRRSPTARSPASRAASCCTGRAEDGVAGRGALAAARRARGGAGGLRLGDLGAGGAARARSTARRSATARRGPVTRRLQELFERRARAAAAG